MIQEGAATDADKDIGNDQEATPVQDAKAQSKKINMVHLLQLNREKRATCTELYATMAEVDQTTEQETVGELQTQLEHAFKHYSEVIERLCDLYLDMDDIGPIEILQAEAQEQDGTINNYRCRILRKLKPSSPPMSRRSKVPQTGLTSLDTSSDNGQIQPVPIPQPPLASNNQEIGLEEPSGRAEDEGTETRLPDSAQTANYNTQKEIIRMLARSNLPDCDPEVFIDDKTKYYTWKGELQTFILSRLTKASEQLNYIQRFTGENSFARSVLAPYVKQGSQTALDAAWKRLDSVFGDATFVCKAHMDKIKAFTPIDSNDTHKLLELSSLLNVTHTDMDSIERADLLDSDENIRTVLIKLPVELIKSWERHCNSQFRSVERIQFSKVCAFIEQEALARSNPRYGRDDIIREKFESQPRQPRRHGPEQPLYKGRKTMATQGQQRDQNSQQPYQNSEQYQSFQQQHQSTEQQNQIHQQRNQNQQIQRHNRHPQNRNRNWNRNGQNDHSTSGTNSGKCEFCNRPNHRLKNCFQIQKCPLTVKRSFFIGHNTCTKCGDNRPQATSHECTADIRCQTCSETTHITAFHEDEIKGVQPQSGQQNEEQMLVKKTAKLQNPRDLHHEQRDWSHIVPVKIFSKKKPSEKFVIYTCVDTESNTCWISNDYATSKNWISPTSPREEMFLRTILTTSTVTGSQIQPISFYTVKDMCIESMNGETVTDLPKLFITSEIPATHVNIPSPVDIRKHKHLKNIASEFPAVDYDVPIVMLLGRNCADAVGFTGISPYPGKDQPCALRTKFGWSISHCKEGNGTCMKIQAREKSMQKPHAIQINNQSAILFENVSENESETSEENESTLNDMIIGYLERDFHEDDPTESKECSRDETQFLKNAKNSIKLVEGPNYSMNLPLRTTNLVLENNREVAVKCLKSEYNKMLKDENYFKDTVNFFAMKRREGYFELVPAHSQSPKVKSGKFNYIRHRGHYHPKKGKFRSVFNVPGTYKGQSLDQHLLSGPNLISSLFGTVIRFRKDRIAILCDIEQMFNRVQVHPEDRDYLRFVWFAYDENGNIDFDQIVDYRMSTHVFGATSSPSCAIYALHQTAEDNKDDYSAATIEFIMKDFYVDDGCTSTPTLEKAKSLCTESIEILAKGGFKLHKFMSNNKELLQSLDPQQRAKELDSVDLTDIDSVLPENPVLGLLWDPNVDIFKFEFDFPDKPYTRAGLLATIHSIYDPLGFLAPVLLEARLIAQELCHTVDDEGRKLEWDDPIPPNIETHFYDWKSSLKALEKLEIPRSFIPEEFGNLTTAELHHFGDASNTAYGCCSYLRVTDDTGRINVSFVAGKSRVCPIGLVSIPRKELVSAVTATELSIKILREFHTRSQISPYPEIRNFYYSDSEITLAYIDNDSKPLKLFCANRANFIARNSDKNYWFHVKGEINPADYSSRGIKAENLSVNHPYLRGPDFLWSSQPNVHSDFEPASNYALDNDDPECKDAKKVKPQNTCNVVLSKPSDVTITPDVTNTHDELTRTEPKVWLSILDLLSKCSSLETAKNRIRLVLEFIDRLRSKVKARKAETERSTKSEDFTMTLRSRKTKTYCPNKSQDFSQTGPLETDFNSSLSGKLQKAQLIIIRLLQLEAFSQEFKQLQKTSSDTYTPIKTDHVELSKLSPFYDSELGVLRVGGRLSQSTELSLSERHPIIIPKSHHITWLIIDFYHRKIHHQGHGITLNAVRASGLWIIHGSSQVRNYIHNCIICRRLRSGELQQRMCDLPIPRTISGLFIYVGIDVFGPFEVLYSKRSTTKRYGLIFTCFASRAIHLEKLHDMTTDRFLNALTRFVSRRGQVHQMWCDRGTNFVGAKNEISTALDSMDNERIKTKLAQQYGTDYFRFGYPFSSHKNGHVERQIRTVRSVLENILFEYKSRIDDDTLETFLAESECVVNSRPLSVANLNDPYSTPISPMTILTQKSTIVTALPGNDPVKEDMYLHQTYKRSRYLSNEFWKQWKLQYLCELQKRDKWFTQKRNLQAGDIVLLRDDDEHRNHWPLGRIESPITDSDGLVRKATVSTEKGKYDRPITRMHLLVPVEEQ